MRHGESEKVRKPPAQRFFLLVDFAMIAFAVWAIAHFADWDTASIHGLLWLAWAGPLTIMLRQRGQDEFWQLCWRRAAAATFAGLLLIPPLYSFGLGFYSGLTTEPGTPAEAALKKIGSDIDLEVLLAILFTIFFARFQWARFRGGMD